MGTILRGFADSPRMNYGGVFDWKLGTRGGMEANSLCNRYGLNQWDLILGMVPWLEACQNAGLIDEAGEDRWWAHDLLREYVEALRAIWRCCATCSPRRPGRCAWGR